MTKKQLLKVFTPTELAEVGRYVSTPRKDFEKVSISLDVWADFVRYHHRRFPTNRASDELFNSMMALTLDPARVYSLWEDMTE